MSSADLATVMIACPHCGTRYQVPFQTIGSDGREVQCAQCGKSWHATAQMASAPALVPAADPDQFRPRLRGGSHRNVRADHGGQRHRNFLWHSQPQSARPVRGPQISFRAADQA